MTIVRRILVMSLAVLSLGGCQPEGFEVEVCSLNAKLAFRIHEIDGWISDYRPRPDDVQVLGDIGEGSEYPGMWKAHLSDPYDKRPALKLLTYGQELPGWEVERPAKSLRQGAHYTMVIGDGGRDGYADFVAGAQYPSCEGAANS